MAERSGFTLMEILLVLALMVLLAALAVPTMKDLYDERALSDSGDLVRGKWALARSRAIEDGVPYAFGVVWGSGNWQLAPQAAGYWSESGEGTTEEGTGRRLVVVGTLPDTIFFSQLDEMSMTGIGQSPTSRLPEFVQPNEYLQVAVFLPDGTSECYLPDGTETDTMQLALRGKTSTSLILRLRTLTGAVSSSWDYGTNVYP